MPWHALWPDFLKKRLCRYLLQHYLGHFFKEKISLEQLSIDIYNGTGCVKNLNLDCEALNEQLNEASDSTSPCSNLRNDKTSTVPVEIVSGFVGYISVYIPWHDLFNDFCKLTIKNVQITIRVKQRKPSMFDTGEANFYDDDIELNSDGGSGANSMFSSMFVDSIMNTSMHIAQECLNENSTDPSLKKKTRFKSTDSDTKSKNSDSEAFDDESIKIESSGGAKKDSLLGLEAFASTIDSILSRIKINLENIQIRVENIDNVSHFKFNDENIMSSSTMFSNKPSNGIALELRIKAIKYFDLDSTTQQPLKPTDTTNQQQASTSQNLGNTTKSFNIEGLTVYFDEFIIKDEVVELESRTSFSETTFNSMSHVENDTVTDQSTSYNDETTSDNMRTSFSKLPNDEAPPFNYELNPDIYLYTNPIIFVTFTGIQSIKLTINNMRPTDMIEAAASTSESMTKSMILSQSQRPLMELSAQFGSIKCLLCPKQIHLLIDMVTKLTDYIEAANAIKKSKSMHRNNLRSLKGGHLHPQRAGFKKSVRGCDNRQYEALIHNNLVQDSANLEILLNDDDNDEDDFKTPITTDNEQSVMFYSMMSESIAFSNVSGSNVNLGNLSNSPESTYMMDESNIDGSDSQNDPNKTVNADEEEDKLQQKFVKELKETIEQLQTDIIVANSAKVSLNKSTTQASQHNLFQTFKVTFRMFSLTVLHHDPPANSDNNNQSKASSFPGENSSTKRMLVDRMKALSDNYFDWVSTIEATNLSGMNSTSIDKQMLMKYHQALAFNDHFLILMKPINMSLNQRINQRYLTGTKRQSQLIQYSLNEVALTIGYIQLNEYLVAVKPQVISKNPVKELPSLTRRAKSAKIIEASQAATITELVSFSDSQSSQLAVEQPCFKLQVVVYEPLELINTLSRTRQTFPNTTKLGSSANIQNQLLNRHFENITIQLNQSLACELDISILDRLYYLINDISKYTGNTNEFSNNKARSRRNSNFNENLNNDPMAYTKKFQNFEIKCSQVMKLALRFPIADLRRSPSQTSSQQTKKASKPDPSSTSTTIIPPLNSKNLTFLAQPATMSTFRQLREQILTLHVFDFGFQTLLNQKPAKQVCSSLVNPDQLNLIITCSQINAYYQYSKKERPIHFGLIQQRLNEPRSLLVSIRIPIEHQEHASDLNELYKEYYQTITPIDQDSLKTNYNINVGKANRFNNPTIIEESDENNSDNETSENIGNEKSKKWRKSEDHDYDEDSEDDETCGPFSRIHSLISSEKNRRIVNAGNKQEMQAFIQQSKQNSQSVIQLNLPNLKLLVADQKFLNDIYNCFLNDLIMWLPSPVPPIESALNLFYDVQNNPSIFTTELNDNMTSPIQSPGNLNYLIDYNFDTDFIATRMNFANNSMVSSSEDEALDADKKKFHMCRSEVINPKSDSSDSGSCESDDDASRRKSKKKLSQKYKKNEMTKSKTKDFKNTISVIVNVEKAHLKAFVINKPEQPTQDLDSKENKEDNALKYGEFDIKTDKFHMCIAISESLKEDISSLSQKKSKKSNKSSPSTSKNSFKIEKQHISIYTDEINIAHSTKKCENNVQQLKYPTNFASFENLFQLSKTNDLITLNDPSIEQSLFNSTTDTAAGLTLPNSTYTSKSPTVVVPMVSIGIKSKFNTKLNKKQLLVALNFKNLSLHHLFCSQPDFWIFQLIELFNLIDIDIVGYEVPIVLTELHLNVENSCILYKPLYLPSRALIAFKSLHWSSNVTAESTLTLLVFNIEDIYLFISKMAETSDGDATSVNLDTSLGINLKRDYICIANSDLFELRLLINDEDKVNQQSEDIPVSEKVEQPSPKLKSPLLDIKIRSNLIQLRTCVDSAFALIELINYIVSDGDLHKPNLVMSEFMSSNPQTIPIPKASSKTILERQTSQTLVDEMISAINHEQPAEEKSDSLAINIGNQSQSSSIPIQKSTKSAQFIVGTPPTQSYSFKSASSSCNQQIFYSPQKSQASMSPASVSTAASSLQDRRLMMAPISQPSLSFNFKNPNNSSNMSLGPAASGSAAALGAGTSSSAESLISDMVKEAMISNPMMQSVYGSLNSSPSHAVKNEFDEPKIVRKRYTSLTLPSKSDYMESTALKTVKETSIRKTETNEDEEDSDNDVYKTDEDASDENNLSLNMSKNLSIAKSTSNSSESNRSRSSSSSNSSSSKKSSKDEEEEEEDEKIGNNSKLSASNSEDENLINSIHMHNSEKLKSSIEEENHSDSESDNKNRSYQDDNEDFQFSLPFSGISPSVSNRNTSNMANSCSSENMDRSMSFGKPNRHLMNENNSRRLQFQPQKLDSDEDDDDLGIGYEYNRRTFEDQYDDNKSSENEEDLLRDFDVIEVIPGFGEAPKNNKEFDVKILSTNRTEFTVRDEHFKKPLTKVDVLKAPESYPVPLNIYCVQEISINWCMYGGNDFLLQGNDANESKVSISPQQQQLAPVSNQLLANRINRAVSNPIIVGQQSAITRSRHNSTSSNSLSLSPQQYFSMQSPEKTTGTSPSSQSGLVKFSNKNTSVSFSTGKSSMSSSISASTENKYYPRKAGGRIKSKYDHQNLNWMARGGRQRNLDVCMEIALYKVKTKIDLYADLTKLDSDEDKESSQNESPLLYRVALAIGDIEIRDKLASSPFNMFLFRYESDHCPKHTNSNMFFLKFLCSKSMDAQRLLECDIKVSIQPLRFNIDQDALIFLVEFFTKMASRDLNEFSKSLVPPPVPVEILESTLNNSQQQQQQQPMQTPQQVFIRNFIFSPDLLVRFDFSGKYDGKSETKMDTLTKLLMFAIQLSNTEIKLKRICYRRGFLGAEKLFQALVKEWLTDIQRNQMKNLIKGWGIFNSLIQFFEGFTYLIWYPIEQYRKDGRVLCGIQKGSAAFSTCTVLATIELTNRMFQATKNVAEFFYDLVTPHRANSMYNHNLINYNSSNNALVETILTGVGNNRNIRLRRHPNDIREGLTNAYYVMYEGMNDTASYLMQEINEGAEHKGIPGAIGGVLRQLPSTALAPIVLTTEATCNILSGIRNQLKPDEKRDDDQKWKTVAPNS